MATAHSSVTGCIYMEVSEIYGLDSEEFVTGCILMGNKVGSCHWLLGLPSMVTVVRSLG